MTHATPESFTCGGDSNPLHANPEYHKGCPDSFGMAVSTAFKLAATSQHACPCSMTKTTPKPHPKKPGFLVKAPTSTLPSSQAMLEHHLVRLENNSPFTTGQGSRNPAPCRGSQLELCCLPSSPQRCCCKSKERISYLPQPYLLDCQQWQRDW